MTIKKSPNVTARADAAAERAMEIHARFERLEQLVLVAHRLDFQRQLGEDRAHRLKLAEEQRTYVDRQDTQLRDWLITLSASAPQGRTLWSRLRWLILGR